jgi:membrane fusion protein (multidrug efflux system)
LTLPEQRVSELAVGQEVAVAVDAFKGRTFSGRITAIDPRLDAVNRTVMVQATVANAEQLLRPGMFVSAAIQLGQVDRVVSVVKIAVDYSLYGDSVYVVVPGAAAAPGDKPAMKAERRAVLLGPQRGDRIAVLRGLEAGEEVIVAGQMKLQNGFPVIVDNTIKLSTRAEQAAVR